MNEVSDRVKSDAFAKMKSLHVHSDIKYRYAKTVVTSIVENSSDKAEEIYFNLFLPESAFISGFQMEIDGNTYNAHVKETKAAKIEYDDAVRAGRTAGHVAHSVRYSNKFTVSVNVESKNEVTFKLTYEELLKRELSVYKHCVNIDPGQLVPDLKVEVHIEESNSISLLEVPPLRESNELNYEVPQTANSSLAVIQRPGPNKADITWAPTPEQQKQINKDGIKGQLVVRYDVDRISKPEEVLVNHGYFVHFLAPNNLLPMRKHATFVLDVSGSMSGRKVKQLIEAMVTILNDLKDDDFFSLVIFSSTVIVWDVNDPTPKSIRECLGKYNSRKLCETVVVPVTPPNIKNAKKFIKILEGCDSTNIYGALMKALEVVSLGKTLNSTKDSSDQLPESIIVFLTDGQGDCDSRHTFTDVTSKNSEVGATIFSLGFGEDADMSFLKKLSLSNSGFVRKIYEASDASLQLKNFFLEIASPLLRNVKFIYEDDKVDNATVTRTSFPTLFQGSELVIVGRLLGDDIAGELVSSSRDGDHTSAMVSSVVLPDKTDFMERMWAYLTIQQLLDSATAASEDESAKKNEQALELALKYSFVTPLTSLVVVKPEKLPSSTAAEADEERLALKCEKRIFGCMDLEDDLEELLCGDMSDQLDDLHQCGGRAQYYSYNSIRRRRVILIGLSIIALIIVLIITLCLTV